MKRIFRYIAIVCLSFLISIGDTTLFARDQKRENRFFATDNLAPETLFWKMPTITEEGSGFSIKDDSSEEPLINNSSPQFKDDVVFLYVSRLIGQVMTKYRGKISAEGLVDLIEKHLSHLEPFSSSRFEWRDIYKDGNTFCLPYVKEPGIVNNMLLLRYYLPEDAEAGLFGDIFIPIGLGDVRVTCDRGEGINESDALMVYLNLIRGEVSLSGHLSFGGKISDSFFQSIFEVLFFRLHQDFENTREFIDICREIISNKGVGELRQQIALRDPALVGSFLKIQSSSKTQDRNLALYGILFFFITSTPEHIGALQKTEVDLYDEALSKGFLSLDPSFRTGVERGIYIRGDEVFEAGKRKFSLSDLLEWTVPLEMVREIGEYIPEIKERAEKGRLDYFMEENTISLMGWRYSLEHLREDGVPEKILNELENRRIEMENLLKDFRKKREKMRQNATWALSHIYDEFMENRPASELSLDKRGESYHIAAHSVVHLYPKGLIYEGDNAVFMRSLMLNYGESVPKDRKWTSNAEKIIEAIRTWEEVDPGTERIRSSFRANATVIELDMDTRLLFSDPDKNVVRPIQIGRSRHVFYLSKEYLDGLDKNNRAHMRELAFLLKLGESFLDTQEKGSFEDAGLVHQQEALNDFNIHFSAWISKSKLAKTGEIKARLSRGMKLDFIDKYTNAIEEILKEEEESLRIQRELGLYSKDFSAVRSDIRKLFWLNYSLLSRYSGMGMSEMADKTYRKLKEATKALQKHDKAGLMPYDFQIKLIFTALKFGHWDDFINETETLLTGRNSPAGFLEEEKIFVRKLITPIQQGGKRRIEEDLIRSLRSQARVMVPEKAEEIERKLRGFIEESKKMEESAINRDQGTQDDFDRIVAGCRIIDLEETCTRDEVFDMVAEEASEVGGLSREDIMDKFLKREAQGSTVVMPGFAIPHIAIGSEGNYQIVIVRARKGIIFPGEVEPVKVMFALVVPRGEPQQDAFHLKVMMAIAMIGQKQDFMEKWLASENENTLREMILNAERRRDKPEDKLPVDEDDKNDGSLDIQKEVAKAGEFIDSLINNTEMRALKADKKGKKIVIGIDTEWMTKDPAHMAALQGLLNKLSYISKKRGFDGIIVRRRQGAKALAGALLKVKKDNEAQADDFVILSDMDSIEKGIFKEFKGEKEDEGAFFAGVRLSEKHRQDSYVRIMEMLTIAINMAFGITVDRSEHPDVLFNKITDRFYELIPSAARFDPKVYMLQMDKIDVRA